MIKKILGFLILVILTIATYLSDVQNGSDVFVHQNIFDSQNEDIQKTVVSFIDVSQGDSSLIVTGSQAILIDGGRNADETNVCEYIESQGVKSIDLIIATHPHEDHIGGLDAVMEKFDVYQILMPDVPYNTKTYEDVITSANENGTEIIYPDDYYAFEFESGLTIKVLTHPAEFESSNVNNDSVVCRVEIGETSILYTGDMEQELEVALLSQVEKADILKVGHHGSNTSSTDDFLDRVSPSIAIISCGFENSYGHPHVEVIDRLTIRGIEILQTQYEGTIVFEF
ncbi:MAG: ComEC/Rec2 family competence protein [Clostridia bacterium]